LAEEKTKVLTEEMLQLAPESEEERAKLAAGGFCIVAGRVIPEGQTACVAGGKYFCSNVGPVYQGAC
jgi:hypothetical protein